MIVLRRLTFARAGHPLVRDASLQIAPGWRVGLVGGNGSGKSTFFALFNGGLHPESGDLEWPERWVMAHVAQETPALPSPALDFVLDGDEELRRLEADLARAEASHDGEAIGTIHARLGEIGGYGARARAAELLHGLGFHDPDFSRPVAEFSGGWRMRLNLARALMCRSDLLLLDEPTNHLDLDAVLWLETWLKSYRGTLLLISHDRDFLDAVCGNVLAIEQQAMTLYKGGYSDFETQRAAQLAQQQSLFEKQQREVAHLQAYIDRFRAKATKARQAQSRIKALARMETVAAAHVDTPFTFSFREPEALPDPLLSLDKIQAGYRSGAGENTIERTILSHVRLTIRPGDRIGLLGMNGAGKSTLIKLLAGVHPPLAGERQEAKALKIGYFAQHQVEALRPEGSALDHLRWLDPDTPEQQHRDYLGGFDFRGDAATRPVGPFSGGEKSRLALALLIWQRPNLLLLDEPTNHLDLEMREALAFALQGFEGGVVLVSHDRHLVKTTADTLLLVADGQVAPFDGDLDDYAAWLAQARNAARPVDVEAKEAKAERAASREADAAARKELLAKRRPLVKESEQLEKKLHGWQGEKKLLEERLADSSLYTSPPHPQLAGLLKRQGELATMIEDGEMRWLEVQEALEALPEA